MTICWRPSALSRLTRYSNETKNIPQRIRHRGGRYCRRRSGSGCSGGTPRGPDAKPQFRPGRSEAAVRIVALSLHAVHGTAGRNRWFRRGGLGSPARSMARRRRGDHAGARAADDALGRDLCGLLSVARRRRAARHASRHAQPAVGRGRIEPGGHWRIRRPLPTCRRGAADLRQLRVGRPQAVRERQRQRAHGRRQGSGRVGSVLQRSGE